ncbi:thiamine-phosphate pyrophosphorylase [Aphanomyces astaci]|uniref:thiamine phosphate synthase n=1 Tax=Aphanomyces astaci TaxID=112090 RepID=W4H3S8_APHAT|nr:thiamine-phosphate pyrophosphorylase [Aphanomyces astaci]ETV85924.1 thiamine-phosphate pyrophosphorylase [Aphanomyces astaci]|eukprot:XP_009824396.1 thiamine-phosphate pyrophosphorylase [Aphanomyces astaci]
MRGNCGQFYPMVCLLATTPFSQFRIMPPTLQRSAHAVKSTLPWLYMVTPSIASTDVLVDTVEKALRGGVNIVQLRNKIFGADSPELKAMAVALRELTRSHNVPLIINDHVALALDVGADGAHIGQEDTAVEAAQALIGTTPSFLLGVTVRDAIQAQAACKGACMFHSCGSNTLCVSVAGADYLGVGPVYASSTKQNANNGLVIGLDGLASTVAMASQFHVPVVAIGGIHVDRVEACMSTKAAGVAVVAALSSSSDVQGAAAALADKVRRHHTR